MPVRNRSSAGAAPASVTWLPLAFIVGLALFCALPRIQSSTALLRAFAGASALLFVWWLIFISRLAGRRPRVEIQLRPQHYLQAIAHCSIFVYWGVYWLPLRDAAWLIAAQIVFAYAFDSLLTWSRRDTYTLGFGPFPIIFSTNLFLRFHDDWFIWQFVMVAVGFLAKELIRWEREGKRVHVFNPSSFPLALASVVLIVTKSTGVTWGVPIATELFLPPHIYLFIFLVALPGQYLFGVTTMTLSAVLATYGFSVAYFAATGTYFFIDSNIPIAVFLGMHLLFTDPSTSPKTELGRIIFGVIYGLSVVALYAGLGRLGLPTFYDKLLQVPLMNLMVRAIDRWVRASPRAWLDPARWGESVAPAVRRLAYTSLWVLVFGAMTAAHGLGDDHPGHTTRFWRDACGSNRRNACEVYAKVLTRYCGQGSGWACNEAGMLMVEQRLRDNSQAKAAFESACALEFRPGCSNRFNVATGKARHADPEGTDYPIILSRGKGPVLSAGPLQLIETACHDGWMEACGLAGLMELTDVNAPDRPNGVRLLQTACDGGHAESCTNLAFAYKKGDGVTPNPAKELELLKRACDLGLSQSCQWLAEETRLYSGK